MNRFFDELETGTLLKFRDSKRGIKLGDGAHRLTLTHALYSYEKFKHLDNRNWDIVGYIEPNDYFDSGFLRKFLNGELDDVRISWSWEEPAPVEKMTLRQVCDALGKEIELIPE